MVKGKLLRELDILVVSRVIVQLCYGHLGVILGSKGLKLIRLSIKKQWILRGLLHFGGPAPGPPTKSAPVTEGYV